MTLCRTQPKPKRLELPKYLDWLKKQPCSLMLPGCLWTSGDAHHTKSKGSGAHDNYGIPCCRVCHTLVQNATEGQMTTWGTSKAEMYRMAIESFAKYLLIGKGAES